MEFANGTFELKIESYYQEQRQGLANGLNAISFGDCIPAMQGLPTNCVDFVLTDPPYMVNYRDRAGRQIANDKNSDWLLPSFREVYRVLKNDSFCVSFYGWNKIDTFLSAWRECGFRPVGHFVFIKKYASSVGFSRMCHECAYLLAKGSPKQPTRPAVDVVSWEYTGNKLHPTQKPVSSLRPLIEAYSKPGDIVLDPFAGSGSTAEAALRSGRRFIAFEKDAAYFAAAKERLVTFRAHM